MTAPDLTSGRVFQQAFIVPEIGAALTGFSRAFDIGGWLLVRRKDGWPITYRGEPGLIDISVGLGFAGGTMYELIEQHDDTPSVYRDTVAERGHGFHHWGIVVDDLDAEIARRAPDGDPIPMMIEGNQGRAAYLDARTRLGGMIELIQRTPEFESFVDFVFGRARPLGPDGPDIKRIG